MPEEQNQMNDEQKSRFDEKFAEHIERLQNEQGMTLEEARTHIRGVIGERLHERITGGMVDAENGDHLEAIHGNGVNLPTDAGYLRWVRLTANDHQLLEMRDANRAIPAFEQAQSEIQEQYMTLLKILAFVIHEHAFDHVDGDDYPVVVEVRRTDLAAMAGLNLDGTQHDDGDGWTFTLRPATAVK